MSRREDTLLSRAFSARARGAQRTAAPSSARLSEILDQLQGDGPGPALPSGAAPRAPYGGGLRPITNILRNPDHGFGPRTLGRPATATMPAQPPAPAPRVDVAAEPPAHLPMGSSTSEDALPIAAPASAAAARGAVQPHAEPGRAGEVIAVFATRGGVGATTIAINTAASLAARGNEVCVIDLNLELGDVFVALDIEATTSLAAVARDADKLDGSTLRRRMVRHSSGVWALGQEGAIDDVGEDFASLLPELFALLRRNFDYVIIDGLRGFAEHVLAALDAASQVHVILAQDVMSVRRAARAITLFRRLGYGDDRLRVLLSRSGRSPVTSAEVQRSLGLAVTATFRDDPRRVQSALDAGALVCQLAAGKGIGRDFAEAAAVLESARRRTADRGYTVPRRGALAAFLALFTRKGALSV